MGKIYNNLINTTAGFKYNAQQPLDDREVVQSFSDLAGLISANTAYEGMKVYVVDDKKSYELINTEWKALATEDYVNTVIGNLDLGDGTSGAVVNSVLYTEQSLTEPQKAQARTNIGITLATDEDVLEILSVIGAVIPVTTSDGKILTSNTGAIYTL